jgi:hypothetical protein
MGKPVIKLKWSKRENDWVFDYPDNSGKFLMGVFFEMMKTTGHRVDWEENLKTMLTNAGYDYTTLKITVSKKEK